MNNSSPNTISIEGLNKAEVLAALYNRAKPQGLGFLHYTSASMTITEAQQYLDQGIDYFDYLKGRVMKVSLKDDQLYTGLYDRDNGQGAAASVIDPLRRKGAGA